tara:strand:- start:140 stop:580 length:441 start_codon:yes stop_codon:yes gene_type:complete
MGTRSLTRVIPRQKGLSYADGHLHPEKAVVNIYRHYDGYPEGMGLDLAEFLSEFTIVNGLGEDSYKPKIANGVGCLAAQLVQFLKDGPGNVYLETLDGDPGDSWEEYIYTIYPKESEPTFISIYDVWKKECIFVGTAKDLQTKYDD